MTRSETVKEAISHRSSGRVPYAIHLTSEAMDKYGNVLLARYADKTVTKAYESREISKPTAVYSAIGNFVLCVNPPWWVWTNRPREYNRDPEAPGYLLQTRGVGNYEAFEREVRYLKENTDCYVLALVYGSHFEKANDARGIENFLADMGGEKDFAKMMLDNIIRKNMVMLENIVSSRGLDGILLGSDWGSQQSLLMSPASWDELIAGGEKQEYDLIRQAGKDVWIHSCGKIEVIIPKLIAMGANVLNPIQPECMDIFRLKDDFGEEMTFWGGISTQQTLPLGSPDDVRTEVRRVVEYMSRNGGYISAAAQEIQTDVSFENLCALIDTVKEYA